MDQERLSVTVTRILKETDSVNVYYFERTDGLPMPENVAGDHIDVHLPGDMTRQYSLCNVPGCRTEYRIAVKKESQSRGGSRALHEEIHEGDQLMIGWPRNNFKLVDNAHVHVLLAGGIGVTPILSMALALHASDQPFCVHYFTQSQAQTPFFAEISESELARSVELHLGLTPVQVAQTLENIVKAQQPDADIYFCGPVPFMKAVEEVATAAHWPQERLHSEHFGASVPDQKNAGAFTVTLARSEKTILVPPDKTILNVLNENGIAIPTSCEQGICGTCVAKVISGRPDHRDGFLSEFQKNSGKKIVLCVSRSLDDELVLDL